jgi:hypothetical protein
MDGNRTGGAGDGDDRPRPFGLEKWNIVLLSVGAVVVLSGYILLNGGSVTLAPLLLVAGYVVLIPAGLLVGFRRSASGRTESREGE